VKERSQESYGQHGSSWVDKLGVWLSGRALRRTISPKNKLRILDLGCGYHAKNLIALSPILQEGMGIDFQVHPSLKKNTKMQFIEGSIDTSLPLVSLEKFDVILMISVLEHLRDTEGVLKKIWAGMKPGSQLLINVPTWRGKRFLEFSAFRLGLSPSLEMDDHKMYYDLKDLWPVLISAGFIPSMIRLRTHKFGLNLFGEIRRQ